MRLSLRVNDHPIATSSLQAKGWLGAHVNVSNELEPDEPSKRVWLNTIDISASPNATHSDWEGVQLSVGDRIEITLLPDGDSDPPTKVTHTSTLVSNLFSDEEQARLLLSAIEACDKELAAVADRAARVEPDDEMDKIRIAIGTVLAEIDQQLISPTLRRHPQLLAEAEMKGLR